MGIFDFRPFLFALSIFASCATAANAQVELPVSWLPAESTYNGNSFVDLGAGEGRTVADSNPTLAYGKFYANSGETFGRFLFTTSQQQFASSGNTDITATALTVGTELDLVFELTGVLQPQLVTATASGETGFSYVLLDNNRFRIRATIINPVAGQYGDAGSAFGVAIYFHVPDDTNDPDVRNRTFEKAPFIFTTNAHPLVVSSPPETATKGTILTGLFDQNGIATDVYAFLPLPFVEMLGESADVAAANLVTYINGQVVESQGLGFASDLGFNFADEDNPDNTVYRLKLTSAAITPVNNNSSAVVAFGRSDTTPPTLIGVKKLYRAGANNTATLTFRVSDQSRVTSETAYFEYTDNNDIEERGTTARKVIDSNGRIKVKIKRLHRGLNKIYASVYDGVGNRRGKVINIRN